MLELLDTISTF